MDDQDVAADDLDDSGGVLGQYWDEAFLLGGEVALGRVELGHGPHARDANDAVLDCDLGGVGILLEECYQDLIRKKEENARRKDHKHSVDKARNIKVAAANESHLILELL